MADNQVIPSKDPANDDTLAGVMRQTFGKLMQGIDGQLPAQVISYDRNSNTAVVQPLITRLTTDGKPHERGSISSLPVLALGGGGYYINFPLKPGDRGWIEASDRDISLFMQANEMAQPNTIRMHNFSDGRFIPDVMGSYEFSGEDEGKLVIASLDGTVKITLSDDTVRLKGVKVVVDAEESADVNSAAINLNGPVNMPDGATIGGIDFGPHIHDTPDGLSGPALQGG